MWKLASREPNFQSFLRKDNDPIGARSFCHWVFLRENFVLEHFIAGMKLLWELFGQKNKQSEVLKGEMPNLEEVRFWLASQNELHAA